MKLKTQTLDGKGGDIELKDDVFGLEPRADDRIHGRLGLQLLVEEIDRPHDGHQPDDGPHKVHDTLHASRTRVRPLPASCCGASLHHGHQNSKQERFHMTAV